MALKKNMGLGKGIDALFPVNEENSTEKHDGESVIEIDINFIEPNLTQPRKNFDTAKLEELSESIKEFGIIQPIIVKKESDFCYIIIAGERRWRASRLAGLKTMPVIMREYTELKAFEAAIIENIQRSDLNPIEEAECFERLIDEYSFTQEQLSKRIGKNRSYISNTMRMLQFDERIREFIIEGRLSTGHARTLLPITDRRVQLDFAEEIIENELNVRDTEKMISAYLNGDNSSDDTTIAGDKSKENKSPKRNSAAINSIEKELSLILGTKVVIKDRMKSGKIEIDYYSPDELDRIITFFK